MTIKDSLNNIRTKNAVILTTKQKVVYLLSFFALGMILGVVVKYIDVIRSSTWSGNLFNVLSNITSRIGIWILIATVIASWSRTPKAGAIHVFTFFIAMLLTYYIYSMKLFGFFPKYYFFRWGLIALASPLAAYIIWFSRGQGWIAALCAALPIGLIATQGFSFLHTFAAGPGFDFFGAIILFFVLPTKKYQHLKVLPLVIVTTFLLRRFEILGYFIGGL